MGMFDILFGRPEPNPTQYRAEPSTADLEARVDKLMHPILQGIPAEHWTVLRRKRGQLIRIDDYGSFDITKWEKELRRYVTKYLIPLCDNNHAIAAFEWMHKVDAKTIHAKTDEILIVTLANLVEKNICAK